MDTNAAIDVFGSSIANFFGNIDWSPIIPEIQSIIQTSIDRNFTEVGRFGSDNDFGGGSEKWKQSFRAIKEQGQTLSDTGQLAASIYVDVEWDGSGFKIVIGSNKSYAAIHQFGGTVNIPAHERESKWKAKKNKNTGNYTYRFAKSTSKTKNTISRKYRVGAYSFVLPARPFLVIQDEDLEEIGRVIYRYIKSLVSL